ncbi:MAG: alpha/beta fold hydrolase [Chloroflexi bacterium]|nr:alpha/beta fold hydrolase [Chloroflexota bacterium]
MFGSFQPFSGDEHKAFRLNGQHPAALLIHGFPGTPAEMRPLAEALHAIGWTAEAPLLPGFGADIATLPQRKRAQWLAAVHAALTDLQREHHPVIVIGNSLGGALALEMAAHSNQSPPNALVLLAPFCQIDHVLWQALPVLKHVFPQFRPFKLFKPDFSNPETRKGIANFMPDADLDDPQIQAAIREFALPIAMFNEIRGAGAAAKRLAPRVRLPALFVQGTQDELVRPTQTRRLLQRYGGSAQYREVPAAHDLVKRDAPAWPHVEQVVLDFCDTFQRSFHADRA